MHHAMEVCTALHPPLSCQLPPHFLLSYLRECKNYPPSLHSAHKCLCTCSKYIISRMWTHEHTNILYIAAYPSILEIQNQSISLLHIYLSACPGLEPATLCVCVHVCLPAPRRTSKSASPSVRQSVSQSSLQACATVSHLASRSATPRHA